MCCGVSQNFNFCNVKTLKYCCYITGCDRLRSMCPILYIYYIYIYIYIIYTYIYIY